MTNHATDNAVSGATDMETVDTGAGVLGGMMMEWKKILDGLPPIGIPLIVTVKDHLQGKPNELSYPVYYEKSKGGFGYRWSWRYGDFDYDLLPEVSEVVAWKKIPEPYQCEE